ncbi:hypothetical protein TCAL_03587 [Tigriopus californicus]|uniref:E3 ubiquitin-protein ligase Hakai n=1 Tax=Tigriopus californicus TaxID=6832 RepID=A0A553NDK6_TIGCA|nr:E3 ubiquitin-protein ligase Hakai-like [Tigriopus californicus]TRY63498.1 hypothetical protein TCAL_03587 [Tigriopus californicus]|eukprot:TCALIF_03587-PA protein Name:"Similar to CBLL1 E3 ubiquitin-protein ligase Hakai (Gallus gallus)" AED:0.00 eAED:0.00 QI:443/1/1/1/1/1/3/219/474
MRRSRRQVIESDPEDEDVPMDIPELAGPSPVAPQYNMDTDISKLEAPTFTTLDRGPSKTMINLDWDHKLNLVGQKVANPMIHCCDQCLQPILIYGRMIPCKHVFCLKCAKLSYERSTACPRCNDKVNRVEQAGLGSIFMCSHGGSQYGHTGCRRTYLSQRDLQAHIQHRHMKAASKANVNTLGPVSGAASVVTSAPSALTAMTLPELPSAAVIAEATAALVSARKKTEHSAPLSRTFEGGYPPSQSPHHRVGGKAVTGNVLSGSSALSSFQSPPPTLGGAISRTSYATAGVTYTSGSGHHSQQPQQQQQISVISSSSGVGGNRSSNLITIPIQESGSGASPSFVPHVANNGDRRTSEFYGNKGGGGGNVAAYGAATGSSYSGQSGSYVPPAGGLGNNGSSNGAHFSQPPPNFYHVPPPHNTNGATNTAYGQQTTSGYLQASGGGNPSSGGGPDSWTRSGGSSANSTGSSNYYRR